MRKLLLFTFAALLIGAVNAQSLPFSEDFNAATSLPDGWTSNMAVSSSHGNNSNGLYKNVWSSAPIASATTPIVGPIEASTSLVFEYRAVAYSSYPNNAYEYVNGDKLEVYVITTTDTTLVHTIDSSNQVVSTDFAPVIVSLGASYTGQNIAVMVVQTRTDGDYYIDLDNVSILTPVTADVAVADILIPDFSEVGAPINVKAIVSNNTSTVAETWGITFSTSDNVTEESIADSISIPAFGSVEIEFEWTPETLGDYTVEVLLDTLVNGEMDAVLANNVMTSDTVSVINAIIIGDGTSAQYNPLSFYYKNSVLENIYTAEEMGSVSKITSISYDFVPSSALNLPDTMPVKIWVGESLASDLSGGPINADELTLVYDGYFPNRTEAGLVKFEFIAPYNYGGDNFVVLVQHPMASAYYSSNKFLCSEDTTVRTIYAYSDSDEYDPYNLPTGKSYDISDYITPKAGEKSAKAIGGNGYYPNIILGTTDDLLFALPLVEDFNASTSVPDAWEGNMYVGSDHGNNSNGLYKNVWSSAPLAEITTPTVGPITSSTNLSFEYRLVAYSSYPNNAYELADGDKLEVFVITATDTTLVHTIDASNQVVSNEFATIVIDLGANFEGEFAAVKVMQTRAAGDYYIDLDNFNIVGGSITADIEVADVFIPEFAALGSPITITALIKNNTTTVAETWGVEFSTSDNVSEQVSPTTISIPALSTVEVEFDWTPEATGDYTVDVLLSSFVNGELDADLSNNLMTSDTVTVIDAILIGDGTAEQYNPINFYYKNSVIENIYTAEEMGGACNITSIKYDYEPSADLNLPDSMPVKIWVGETNASDLSAGPINASDLAMVYDGLFPNLQEAGLVEFVLDAPYVYAGDNFVVLIQHPMDTAYYSNNKFLCDEDTTVRTLYAYSDSEEYDPYNLPTGKSFNGFDIASKKLAPKAGEKSAKAIGGNGYYPNIVMDYNNDPSYNMTLSVTDGSAALEGATVMVAGKFLTTDASGDATTLALDGTYDYTVSLEGYFESTGSIAVAGADASADVVLTLIPTFAVSGIVNTNAGDVALEGAMVILATDTVITGTDGTFSFTGYQAGEYELSISAEMHASYMDTVYVVDADIDLATITLEEIIVAPAGLLVEVDSASRNATFSWGNTVAPEFFSDDFEGYDDFAIEFDPWTLIDVDGDATYGFNGVTFPNSGAAMAGIIFNPSTCDPDLSEDTPAYSGDKYIAVFNPADASACDDWIISPEVSIQDGFEVSFMARGGNASYSEEMFQVLVSTTGTEVDDFEALSSIEICAANSAEWASYSYDMSAYAGQEVNIAIHVTSVDQFYFCLDDFYVGAPSVKGSEVMESYNVYLNDMETPVATDVTDMEYVFEALANGDYTAGVQAVYTSGVSEIITIDFGVDLPILTYTATLTVTDGTNAIEDAAVTFDGTEYTTDASGVVAIDMLEDGDYAYTVTAEGYEDNSGSITINGADVAETITMVLKTAISQPLAELVNIYPNPATSYISIDNAANAMVEFYNIAGAKVLSNENLSSAARIDVSELQKGVYFVTITRGEENVVERIVIE